MTKTELEEIFNERIASVLRIAGDLVRKKRESLNAWDAGYSADEEQRAQYAAHNAAQDAMRSALIEVEDVCYEVADKICPTADKKP